MRSAREAHDAAAVRVISDTATERVRERLRADILSGIYPPGDRLKIADIALRYGISPIPVREALRLLAGEGLVEMQPHRGAVVRSIDVAYVGNTYDIRMALEAMLVERAVEKLRVADLARIRAAQGAYARAARILDVPGMLEADSAFHGAIRDVAANDEATLVLRRGGELIRTMRLRFGFTAERAAVNVAQHEAILSALAVRDAARAVEVTREHCVTGRDDLIAQFGDRVGEAPSRLSAI